MRRAAALLALVAALAAMWRPQSGLDREAALLAAAAYDARIVRDAWNVPHVFGRRDADVAYGLAWAHAEDDFATIQGALLAARGRLAAWLGAAGAANDYMVGLLRVGETTARAWTQLDPRTRALCDAYAAGLNHYAALHPDDAVPGLYPARGEDVVAGFVHKLPLFLGVDGVLRELLATDAPQPPAALHGSNVFVVAPSRSADGATRIAINSHQPWDGPVAWYEVRLRSDEGWDAAGSLFPGAPVILHGHNRVLGWAHTVNRPDLVDLYRLETDPADPDRYRFDGQWRALEKRSLPIRVKLIGPFPQPVPGDTSATLWTQTLPYDALPQVTDPPSAWLQNCNSSPFQATDGAGNPDPAAFDPAFGIENHETNRALRAHETFGADREITDEEFLRYKFDRTYSERGELVRAVDRVLGGPWPADPVLREARGVLGRWLHGSEAEDRSAALVLLTFAPQHDGWLAPQPDVLGRLRETALALRRDFGRVDPAWGEVLRLRRGRLDLGLGGAPDVANAIYHRPARDGRRVAYSGDSYVSVVSWDRERRLRSRSLQPYGSAVRDPRSPHFADQAPLFARRQLKDVPLEAAALRAQATATYRPGQPHAPLQ